MTNIVISAVNEVDTPMMAGYADMAFTSGDACWVQGMLSTKR